MSSTTTFAAAVFVAVLSVPAAAQVLPGQPGQPGPRVPARVQTAAAQGRPVHIIVGVRAAFRAEGQMNAPAAAAQRAAIGNGQQRVVDRLPLAIRARARRFRLIPFFAAEVDAGTLAQLEADPDVVSIEEDKLVPPVLADSGPLVGAPAAWAEGFSGAGWAVAVLDSGVDETHPFLAGKVISEACYSNAGGAAGGTSLCPGGATESTAPGSGLNCTFGGCDHGTHVAGIAAGRGSSFSGIARDASLISIQVFTRFDTLTDCGFAVPCLLSYTSDEVLALERVYALRTTFPIASVNLSLGGGRYFDQASCDADNVSIKAAIDNLRSAGIATVIAAGNSGFFDSLSAPACVSSAISAGSSTKADTISSFSNLAPFLSLLAPGSSITSSVPGGGFSVKSGTSMSTPHVAGAWAVLKQRRPSASVAQVLAALQTTGVPLTDPTTGRAYPRIQVDAAVAALQPPQLVVDSPQNQATLTEPFAIGGWALDSLAALGTGVDAVHVWAYPASGAPIFVGAAAYGGLRADVGALFGSRFANSGYNATVLGLAPGSYQIVVYAHSVLSGAFDAARVVGVTIAAPVSAPRAVIDAPAAGSIVGPSFLVAGWAIDAGTASPPGVDVVNVYAYPNPGSGAAPVFLGTAAYGGARADVGAVFGLPFANAGYELPVSNLTPGAYRLVVFSHSLVSGQFFAQARDITVRAPGDPAMAIDAPVNGAVVTGPFVIAGWAIDRDAAAGPGVDAVHMWAYPLAGGSPVFLGASFYGGPRPDVGGLFGSGFTNSGYSLTASGLAPGDYDVIVYAHSAVTGSFNDALVVRVNVR